MEIERELKEKMLKLFEETDRQSEEQEAYTQELQQRLYLAEKVCYEASGYLRCEDTPLGKLYLDRLNCAIEKWDSGRLEKNHGSKENY